MKQKLLLSHVGPKCPCIVEGGCPERSAECHPNCKRYLEYEKKKQDQYEERRIKAEARIIPSPAMLKFINMKAKGANSFQKRSNKNN